MSAVDFSSLIPERLKVNGLPDGSSIEMIRREEMNPEELASFATLQNNVREIQAKLQKEGSKEAALAATKRMHEILGKALKLLAPEMTDETLATLRMGHRASILQWWTAQHKPVEGAEGNG